jgi:GT2 family glycosyltransferase
MSSTPRVAVLVLNHNGRDHLRACLPGLEAQTYPNVEVVVVDNGSTDESIPFVRGRHPSARILQMDGNAGFSAPYNRAAREIAAEYLVFLNNDTRVEPTWVFELVEAARRHRAAAVSSRILDWEGRRVDFIGGLTSFEGHSWQIDYGAAAGTPPADRALLFACGCSMMVDRRVFLDAGGFDEEFFAYFEDVDLGWRLSLLGHTVALAPKAVTYHRLHGTSGSWAFAPRLRLYERNALAMISKNYEDATLARVLPVAIALSLYRALAETDLAAERFVLGSRPPAVLGLPARLAAHLIALEDFARALPDLRRKRQFVQERRRRSDAEIFALFGEPLKLHDIGGRYVAAARALIADFGIDDLVAGRSKPRARAKVPAPSRLHVGDGLPMVSVVIPTILGDLHLPACLEALAAQDYPADRLEVVIVDNGAKRDLAPLAACLGARARILRAGRNLGFAAANNLGVANSRGRFVAFLNDDTRADPGWVRAMVEVARRRGAAAVASYVVDWDGVLVDFAGGLVSFEGKGHQEEIDTSVVMARPEERPVLFANGAAMMADRSALLDAGGWDEGTFAYYEDTELGWRLWFLGHEVWFAPQAIVRHRHHGTSGRWPEPPRVRLLERNALRMIYSLLETDHLARALPASLLLAADRALLETPLHRGVSEDDAASAHPPRLPLAARARQELRTRGARRDLPITANLRRVGPRGLFGAAFDTIFPTVRRSYRPPSRRSYLIEQVRQPRDFDNRREPIPAEGAARLVGIHDFLESLPELSARRRTLQARRVRSDAEIFGRFGARWLAPVPAAHQKLHDELHGTLVKHLKLAEIIESG